LNLFGRLEYGRSGSVNRTLNLIKRRLKESLTSVKENLNFEEGLETTSFLGGTSATSTNTLLHLVERVFGGM